MTSTAIPARVRDPQAGVTLIEMLVSLAIFAFVGLASFTMLDMLLKTRERSEGRLEAVARLDRGLVLFERDLAQSIGPDVEVGQGALIARHVTGQDVTYRLEDGVFLREISMDGTEVDLESPLVQTLVTGVQMMDLRVFGPDRTWYDEWPNPEFTRGPMAVELSLTLDRDRRVQRLVLLTQSIPK